MNAIARPYHDDALLEKTSQVDTEYFEAVARMRKHQSSVTSETIKKIKALELPEISGNLSKKRFFFF